jgi:dynein heavy chain 1
VASRRGIFTGSADIKHLLPIESSRFNNIHAEFLAVMKKVVKSPFVLDVLNIPGVQKSLERLAELLGKIQKALGEYLERERSSFPRFYFVGDEDLLEIIGNSKDVLRIQKHLKKMFAGLSSILVDEAVMQIEGMASREGEEVRFKEPIVLKDFPKINDWLTRLEMEMKLSLAHHLDVAHGQLRPLFASHGTLRTDAFLSWIDAMPAQLVVLAIQIEATDLVERALASGGAGLAAGPLATIERGLDVLADAVLTDLSSLHRRKCEHVITELVHERDVIRSLVAARATSPTDFTWLYQMRFYLDTGASEPLQRLNIRVADASFAYGYEYLGVPDRLVQTPLTDRCYYTLTQALHYRLGGAPFGPAGTVR